MKSSLLPTSESLRIASLWVALVTLFIDSIMFSIILPSMAIYLQEYLDEHAVEYALFLGILVAAHPFGQLVGSPVAGYYYNKRGVQESMLVFITFFCGLDKSHLFFIFVSAGCLVYAMAQSEWWLLWGRLLQGFGDGNLAICRAFTVQATHEDERVKWLSWLSAAQALGFLFGAVLGGLLSFVEFQVGIFPVDEYTLPGYFSFLIGIFNLVLVIFWLDEVDVHGSDRFVINDESAIHISENKSKQDKENEDEPLIEARPVEADKVAILVCLVSWFISSSAFSVIETIITPYLNINYGWDVGEVSLVYSGAAVLAVLAFSFIHRANEYISERMLLVGGSFLASGGLLVMGGFFISQASLFLWMMGTLLFFIGHPFAMAITLSLYSKVLGPAKQGLHMALVTATGSLARIVSPLWSTLLLEDEDYRGVSTFSIFGIFFLVDSFICLAIWNRLVPHPLLKGKPERSPSVLRRSVDLEDFHPSGAVYGRAGRRRSDNEIFDAIDEDRFY